MKIRRVVGVLLAVSCALWGCGSGASNVGAKNAPAGVAADHILNAIDFIKEFHVDEAAASAKYKGKVVELRGWFEGGDQDPGPPVKNKNVWISSQCFKDKCVFEFTDEASSKQAATLKRLAFMAAKGRFTGQSSAGFMFTDSVVVEGVNRGDLPVEATGDADDVRKTIASDDLLVRSKYYGRKITVTGPATAMNESSGRKYVVLGKARLSTELRCYLAAEDVEKAKQALANGNELKITGWLHNCDGIEFGYLAMDQCAVGD